MSPAGFFPFEEPHLDGTTVWVTTAIFVITYADLALAMSSTLDGNLTVLGSVANLIVVPLARAHGVPIGFWQYFRVGAPLTLLTILAGLCWL
jgi:Na+/H+ antiporter NhaD/arsenite permease-like protein